jgi:CheY-like chemotaxis protein
MAHILLVEDNTDNARALSRLLTRRGHTVVCAETGREALSAANNDEPALILMDIGLPDIDGLEVTRRIKADPATADIPVIALTAHAMADDRAAALAAGCVDFSPKPINLADLLDRIHAALDA